MDMQTNVFIIEKKKTAKCKCNHNTYGKQCSKCKPFYWMNKWQSGSYSEDLKGTSGLCLSHSSTIYRRKQWKKPYAYTKDLYKLEPRKKLNCSCNGHCKTCSTHSTFYYANFVALKQINASTESNTTSTKERTSKLKTFCDYCHNNTAGFNCERCKRGFFRNSTDLTLPCSACGCNRENCVGPYCDVFTGQCRCKKGRTGKRCDICTNGYAKENKICVKLSGKTKNINSEKTSRSTANYTTSNFFVFFYFFIAFMFLY